MISIILIFGCVFLGVTLNGKISDIKYLESELEESQALLEAEKTQVFRYETVHEVIQKLTNQHIKISELPIDKTPVNLLDYKVNKSNIEQYGQLTGGTGK